jgi:hypothetical protein
MTDNEKTLWLTGFSQIFFKTLTESDSKTATEGLSDESLKLYSQYAATCAYFMVRGFRLAEFSQEEKDSCGPHGEEMAKMLNEMQSGS